MFPTDQSKIAFLITSLTGPALQWAETILNQAGPATQTFSHFLAHFREVFGSSPGDSSIGEQLFQLRQGSMPIHQYSLKFRTLAAASGWNEPSLLTAFRQGLNSRLRLHLATYDDTCGLEKFIQLASSHCHSSHPPTRDQWPSRTHANGPQPPIVCGESETTFPMVCVCIVVRVGTGSWSVPFVLLGRWWVPYGLPLPRWILYPPALSSLLATSLTLAAAGSAQTKDGSGRPTISQSRIPTWAKVPPQVSIAHPSMAHPVQ